MRRFIARRLAIALVSLWVALSIVFLLVSVAPEDFVARKLSNLENQGSEQRDTTLVGSYVVRETTVRAIHGDTLDLIASDRGLSVEQIRRLNPDRDPQQPLPTGALIVVLPGELLRVIALQHRLVLPEDADHGVALLRERNPGIEFPIDNGEPYAPTGAELALFHDISIAEIAHANRITAADILDVNPAGSEANAAGDLSADTRLVPGDTLVMPTDAITSANIRHLLGLDRSLGHRYAQFLWSAVRFDFGDSFQSQEPALGHVARVLPRSVQLNIFALIVAAALVAPAVLLARRSRPRWLSTLGGGVAALAFALPSFWMAAWLVMLVVPDGAFASGLWSIPITDPEAQHITSSPTQFLALYSLPAIAAGVPLAAAIGVRMMRSAGQPDPNWRTVASDVLGSLRVHLPILLGFTMVLELLFNILGTGLLTIQSLNQADIPTISATICVIVLFVLFCHFAIDVARAWLDREFAG